MFGCSSDGLGSVFVCASVRDAVQQGDVSTDGPEWPSLPLPDNDGLGPDGILITCYSQVASLSHYILLTFGRNILIG